MSWGAPAWWGMVAVLLLAAAAATLRRRPPALAAALPGAELTGGRVLPVRSDRRRRRWRVPAAAILALVAAARPQWGTPARSGTTPAREIVIAIDLSRSMAVPDVGSSRLTRALAVVRGMLDRLEGERVALVVFAGTAFVQVPLSADYQIMREFLPSFEPGYLPRGGSDFSAMLAAAAEAFSGEREVNRTLVVLSDGEATAGSWTTAVAALVRRDIRIVALGIGTRSGGEVPAGPDGEAPGVRSRLMPEALQALAAATGGYFRDASGTLDWGELLATLTSGAGTVRQPNAAGEARPERYAWLLVPAVALGFLGLVRDLPVRPRWQDVRRRGLPPAWVGTTAAVGVALAALLAVAHEGGHDYGADVTAAGKLQWVIEDLTRHTTISGKDLALLAERTVNYAMETLARGNTPAEGALRDALLAVEAGERLAPPDAEWAVLRARLRGLMARDAGAGPARPPEQKKDALDEEDRPSQTNGQGSQQTTSESMGQGGAARTEATIGELRRDAGVRRPAARAASAAGKPGQAPSGGGSGGRPDPWRALTLKRFQEVTKADRPAVLFQALAGDPSGAEGGRDW